MNNQSTFFFIPLMVIFLGGFVACQEGIAQESGNEYWFWQKGVEANAESGENSARSIFTMPISKTDSEFRTLDYLFIFTNTGDYIRAGVVYESKSSDGFSSPVSFFYSDKKKHYLTIHPYQPSTESEILIYNKNGWKIAFLDNQSEFFQQFDATWASGESINYGGIVFENGAKKKETITSCESVGLINNIENQKLFFGKNNDEWREPESVRLGYEINQTNTVGNLVLNQIPPPKFAFLTENKNGFQIGFDCPKNLSETQQNLISKIEESKSKIPEWVKNSMKWFVEGKISENEMVNALQFLVRQGIIILD